MSEGRNLGFLEKAIRLIPGYKGYKSKEERRDNDQLFRTGLVNRLERLRTDINEIPASLRGPSALKSITDFDRILKRLERVTDEIVLQQEDTGAGSICIRSVRMNWISFTLLMWV